MYVAGMMPINILDTVHEQEWFCQILFLTRPWARILVQKLDQEWTVLELLRAKNVILGEKTCLGLVATIVNLKFCICIASTVAEPAVYATAANLDSFLAAKVAKSSAAPLAPRPSSKRPAPKAPVRYARSRSSGVEPTTTALKSRTANYVDVYAGDTTTWDAKKFKNRHKRVQFKDDVNGVGNLHLSDWYRRARQYR